MNSFNELSFSFILDLYRIKEKAIKANDISAISSLKSTYSALFSREFDEFVTNLTDCIEDMHRRKGVSFHHLLDDGVAMNDKFFSAEF